MVEHLLTKYFLKRGACFKQRLYLHMCFHDDNSKRREDGESCTGSENVCLEISYVPSPSLAKTSHIISANLKGIGEVLFYHMPLFVAPLQWRECWLSLVIPMCSSNSQVLKSFPALVQQGLLIWSSLFSLISLIQIHSPKHLPCYHQPKVISQASRLLPSVYAVSTCIRQFLQTISFHPLAQLGSRLPQSKMSSYARESHPGNRDSHSVECPW